jgi:thioredoxin 2
MDNLARLQRHITVNDLPVLAMFGAPWCGPCRVMTLELEKVAPRLEPSIRLVTVNIDVGDGFAERYGVRAIPTMILFCEGIELARSDGAIHAAGILRFLQKHLSAREAIPA